jgi:hypothetical protein
MSATSVADETAGVRPRSDMPRRLLVTVRPGEGSDQRHRLYRHVGFLTCLKDGYEFRYVQQAGGFRPLLGFGDTARRYFSSEMFPLFAERIMSARRPDRARYLEALDLSEDSEPWEVLLRSGGRRAGDTIEVLPEPTIGTDGETSCTFLVHGVRHCGPEADDAIDSLNTGDLLELRWEPSNPVNERAVLVLSGSGVAVGYVPDPLVDYVHTVMRTGEHRLSVVRANGPEVGSHLRLLVRLEGHVPDGYLPFGE